MINKFKNLYHFALAWLGDIIYRHPSRRMTVIGVTGTKGKSTTVELLASVLEFSGKKTAFLSSAHIKAGDSYIKNTTGNTMPGRFTIQRWLRQAADAGCQYAVLEVTSQGVVQHRHRFIDFDAAAITCLHPEHIESHGSFEAYREAKVKFFRDVARTSRKARKVFFINTDTGENVQYFSQAVLHPTGTGHFGQTVFYGREDFIHNVLGGDVSQLGDWLSSNFNMENAAAVHAIAKSQAVRDDVIIQALSNFRGVSGRQEFVIGAKRTAVIDYALTPDSLEAIYSFLRDRIGKAGKKGRLFGVFGSAGGGRDTWKRPALGAIAERFCDHVYLTTDDPYDESPERIMDDIGKGISDKTKYSMIVDRKEAIREALLNAGPDDIVAITGMGSQSYTYGPKGVKIPWSERGVVEEILRNL